MNIIFSIISVLGSTASLAFTILFLIFFGKEEYKKSIKFIIFAIISIVLAVYFNTSDVEMYGRAVYYAGGTLMTVAGIFMLFGGKWKVALTTIAISLLFVFCVSNFFGMKFVSSADSYDDNDSNSDKNGFYGSDGEYQEYIPEFGDDVNNWMENNW